MDEINKLLQELGSSAVEERVDSQYDLFLEEQFEEMLAYHNMMMQSCYSYDNE